MLHVETVRFGAEGLDEPAPTFVDIFTGISAAAA